MDPALRRFDPNDSQVHGIQDHIVVITDNDDMVVGNPTSGGFPVLGPKSDSVIASDCAATRQLVLLFNTSSAAAHASLSCASISVWTSDVRFTMALLIRTAWENDARMRPPRDIAIRRRRLTGPISAA